MCVCLCLRASWCAKNAVFTAAPHTRLLTPTVGNVHQFTAGPAGAAFLDFIGPAYAPGTRDCTYYQLDDTQGAASSDVVSLIPVHEPDNLVMVEEMFRGTWLE